MCDIQTTVRRWLPQGRFARNASVLAGGTALSQALAVVAAPVLTRLYPVTDFGYFQVYMSFMAFGALAVTLRYEQAIFLPDREDVAANVFVVALCTVAMMSGVFAGLGWFVHHYGFLPKNAEGLRPYLWILPVSICGAGIYQTLSVWALRHKAYRQVSGTKIAQVASQLATQTTIGFLYSSPLGLLLGDALGAGDGKL